MTQSIRWPIALATIVGLAVAIWAIGQIGLNQLVHAALSLGVRGFLVFCLGSLVLTAILGGAWLASMPGQPLRRLPLFSFARLAREGANDLLPFSQVGGLVVGARTLTGAGGLAPACTYAAMIVDITTEMASQLVFTLFGVIVLAVLFTSGGQAHHLGPVAWIGGGIMLAITGAFILFQRLMLRFGVALAGRLLPNGQVSFERLREALDAIYRQKGAVAVSFLLNLAGWVWAAVLAALALRLMGEPLPVWRVIAMESVIFAIRGAAFLIPGAIGVQEAGYLLLAQAVGLDPQVAIALSLVKRARDVALGLPALIAWQAMDLRPRTRPTAS